MHTRLPEIPDKSASVSVIIVNWNSGKLLRQCVEHLKKQSQQPTEIMIIDNASTDDSALFTQTVPGITLHKPGTNLGFAAANNLALASCNTEYVALLNPDAFPEPDWLERLLAMAWTHPDYAAFGSRQMIYGADNIADGLGDAYHYSGLVWRNGHGARLAPADLSNKAIFSPCAAAALYRLDALLSVGGFDEDYFCYVEDVDLGFRLRLAGYKALYVADAVVHHVGSATTGGLRSDFSVYHGHRNLVWTFVKNMPGPLFWFLLPAHIALNLASVIFFVMRGQGGVIFRAKRDAIKGLAKMLVKRRAIQRRRKAPVKEIWKALDKSPPFFR